MKKVSHIIKNILVGMIVVIALSMMIFTVISVSTFDRTDRDLFGYKAFIVQSDSMSATDFEAGDLILVKEVEPKTLKEGDIISFQSTNNENYGEVVTHKIREVTTDDEGNLGFVTYGTTTNSDDENVVSASSVIGKYHSTLSGVGKFFAFLKTVPGYFVCIFLPFMILIVVQGINTIRLFKQYKKEQLAEIDEMRKTEKLALEEERKKLEEERLQSQQMIAELQELKDKLTGSSQEVETNEQGVSTVDEINTEI